MRRSYGDGLARVIVAGCVLIATHAMAADAQDDSTASRRALARFDSTCAIRAARIWGAPLCGPVVLVNPRTRQAYTNRQDPAHAFIGGNRFYSGTYPAELPLANTSFLWTSERWASVLIPMSSLRFDQISLLAHEAFHRLQDSLKWGGNDASAPHLATRAGRLWWRLELRALEYALTTADSIATRHARAAAAFRHRRHQLFPGSDTLEAALEYHEGLAEYTGHRVAHAVSDGGMLRTVDHMRRIESSPSLVRGFAYATGPALGLLLDRLHPRWHGLVRRQKSPAALLAEAVAFRAPGDSMAVITLATEYGYARIAREEATKERDAIAVLSRYRQSLVEGPVLRLSATRLQRSFDPNALIPLDSLGTVYPTGSFAAEWGSLEVTSGGALVSPDFQAISVPMDGAPSSDRVIRGKGWELRLAEGWRLAAGARSGDASVVRE
jgi:hypothetical protein